MGERGPLLCSYDRCACGGWVKKGPVRCGGQLLPRTLCSRLCAPPSLCNPPQCCCSPHCLCTLDPPCPPLPSLLYQSSATDRRDRERERLLNGEQRVLRRAGLYTLTASHGPRASDLGCPSPSPARPPDRPRAGTVRAAAARGVFAVVGCGLVGHTGRRAQHWSPFRGMLGWVFSLGDVCVWKGVQWPSDFCPFA